MNGHTRRLVAPIAALFLLLLAGAASAQPPGAARPQGAGPIAASLEGARPWLKLDRRAPASRALADSARQGAGSRDSLKNGVIIGAVVGAVAAGVFGAVLCNALQEPGDPSCLTGTLRIAAFGAAVGAGGGLAVDAALSRRSGLRVAVGFRF
jgi:hypothetical protein